MKKNVLSVLIFLFLLFGITYHSSAQLLMTNEMEPPVEQNDRRGLMDMQRSSSPQGWTGNQTFGLELEDNYVSVGGGIGMLVVAGVGYALMKSKKSRRAKGFQALVLALLMLMGFTQCRKEPAPNITPILEGETRHINLALINSSGNKDNRYGVRPIDMQDIAPVYYELGDSLLVAYNGNFVGYIKCKSLTDEVDINGDKYGVFEGNITITQDGDHPLYFYFLGNRKPTWTSGNTFTVDISDQTTPAGGLPVISYACSTENFSDAVSSYTVQYHWLRNQCALVKFKMENIYDMSANTYDNNPEAIYTTDKDITIYGMDNQVAVNLSGDGDAQFSWSKNDANGSIKLFQPSNSTANPDSASMVRFAIIHHADYSSVTAGELNVPFDPVTDPYGFYGTYKMVANPIKKNDYCDSCKLDLVWHSGAFKLKNAGSHVDNLVLSQSEFTSSEYYVVFSRGNLQYRKSDSKWRLAKHQYDYVGGGLDQASLDIGNNEVLTNSNYQYIGNVVLDVTDSSSPELTSFAGNRSDNEKISDDDFPGYIGWIDLYGWGTGLNPTEIRQENSHYATYNEWGDHTIENDGTSESSGFWYTLRRDEWQWLLNHRTDHAEKMGFGIVCGVKGLILLPENWSMTGSTPDMPSGCPTWEQAGSQTLVDDSWNMTFDEAQWLQMELRGAVFLPAAGYRGSKFGSLVCDDYDGGGPYLSGGSDQDHGAYWSSTKATHYTNASSYYMRFGNAITGDHVNPGYYMAPDNGNAVRLVHKID